MKNRFKYIKTVFAFSVIFVLIISIAGPAAQSQTPPADKKSAGNQNAPAKKNEPAKDSGTKGSEPQKKSPDSKKVSDTGGKPAEKTSPVADNADKLKKTTDKPTGSEPGGKPATGSEPDKPAKEGSDPAQNGTPAPDPKEAELLKKEQPRADWIEKTLKYGLHKERRDAARRVQSIKTPALRKKLIPALIEIIEGDDEPEVQIAVITALGEINATEASPQLMKLLDSSNEEILISSVYALTKLKESGARDRMIELLKKQDLSNDSNLTEALIGGLGDFKAVSIYPFAKEAIENPKTTKNLKENLVLLLGKLESAEPKEFLFKLFKDGEEDTMIRAYAVNSMARAGYKDAIPEIHAVLKEIDSYTFNKRKRYHTLHLYSIGALAKLGDTGVVPRLVSALRSDSPAMRIRAINLLKDLGDKSSVDILKYRMENDPDPGVKRAAQKALKELGVDAGETTADDDKDGEKDKPDYNSDDESGDKVK
jgi:HEAT repeat protein